MYDCAHTTSISVHGLLVSTDAFHRAGLVLTFKLSVGTGCERCTLIYIYNKDRDGQNIVNKCGVIHTVGCSVPVQLPPSPVKPGLHVQVKLCFVLRQSASLWQGKGKGGLHMSEKVYREVRIT